MTSLRMLIMSALSVAFLGVAAPAPALAERAPVAQVERGAAPAPATDRELKQYAEREQQSAQLERFEGGATIVIFGSATALLLAVLIILIVV